MKITLIIDISKMNLTFARTITRFVMPFVNKIRAKDKSEGKQDGSSFQRGIAISLQELEKKFGIKIESTSGLRSLIGKAGSMVKNSHKKK